MQTFLYTHESGLALSLQFPARTSGVTPQLSVKGCGFLQLCVYFNAKDQRALVNGAGVVTAGLICAIPGVSTAACIGAGAVIAIATTYVNDHGLCPGDLRVRLLPVPGDAHCE